jgi:hypothetical protein
LIYGSSKVKELLPDEQTGIEISDFKKPQDLAIFINELNKNDSEYEKYLRFKKKGGIRNRILLDLMEERKWGIHNDRIKGILSISILK